MTKTLHRLPLDEWFDDVPHPHDSMPIATDKSAEPSLHEKMYRLATANGSTIGGSENARS
ncbi:MAG: hypothetical protein CMA59_00695 [Euryarchaeota archaeon]|jgi:hypothetical protein|nr:hypothetical protein [Euryarchaeota archaeon]